MQNRGQICSPKGKRRERKWAVTKPKQQESGQRVSNRFSSISADLGKGLLLVSYGTAAAWAAAAQEGRSTNSRVKAKLGRNHHWSLWERYLLLDADISGWEAKDLRLRRTPSHRSFTVLEAKECAVAASVAFRLIFAKSQVTFLFWQATKIGMPALLSLQWPFCGSAPGQ